MVQPVPDAPVPLLTRDGCNVWIGDSLTLVDQWRSPTCIIVDGPYGLGLYPGEPERVDDLPSFYEPHAHAWAAAAGPSTTLWFWNTEVGWAVTHPVLVAAGWDYVGCNIWNKGMSHLAGNVNTATLRRFPPTTEVCAHYVRRMPSHIAGGNLQSWLRNEWARTGLPWNDANKACGVADAATRKWLTADECWYPPPPEAFERLASYANECGHPDGRPYFDLTAFFGSPDGTPARDLWANLRPRFNCPFGVSNVWEVPPVRGKERLRTRYGTAEHVNQKPLLLMERLIEASTNPGEVVWEPFAGTGTAILAAWRTGRQAEAADILSDYARVTALRLRHEPTPLPLATPVRAASTQDPLFGEVA